LDDDIRVSLQSQEAESTEHWEEKLPLTVQLIESVNINSDIKVLVEAELKRNARLKLLEPGLQMEVVDRLAHQDRPM